MPIPLAERPVFVSCWRRAASSASSSSRRARRRGVHRRADVVAAGGGGGAVDAADAAAAGGRRPLAAAAPGRRAAAAELAELDEPQEAPVIIAGFGRYGQIVGRLLLRQRHARHRARPRRRAGRGACAASAGRCTTATPRGSTCCAWPVRPRARVLVVAIDDVEHSLRWSTWRASTSRSLPIVARARNVTHWYAAARARRAPIERETFDAALMSGRSVLEALGWERHHARTLALRFRRHSVEQLERWRRTSRTNRKLIAIAKQGRRQLEELWAREREERPAHASAQHDAARQPGERADRPRTELAAVGRQRRPSHSSLTPVAACRRSQPVEPASAATRRISSRRARRRSAPAAPAPAR